MAAPDHLLFPALLSLLSLQDPAPRDFAAELLHVAELYRLTDEVGEDIFPGFDARAIPIAINFEDRQELLIAHPRASAAYKPLPGADPDLGTVLVRDGVSRYGPRGGGWAVELLGEQTAYVGIPDRAQKVEEWLSLVVHECFHVYQRRLLKKELAGDGWDELPEFDSRYLALIALESRVLAAAFLPEIQEGAALRELAELFAAVRAERRRNLSAGAIHREDLEEYNEGTATYSQARLLERMVELGGIEPVGVERYSGFEDAARMLKELLARIVPAPGLLEFVHAQYHHGMAQCLLLDRLRPDWKQALAGQGLPLSSLLDEALALDDERRRARFEQAAARFDLEKLLAEQTACVDERIALLRGFLEGEGRRYRIFHGDLREPFNWKPQGPVYHVPGNLLPKEFRESTAGSRVAPAQATVWAGGFEAFDQGHLHFHSKAIPIVFGPFFFEWIDRKPTGNSSDLQIESDARDGDVYRNARVKHGQFELNAAALRVVRRGDVVELHPVR